MRFETEALRRSGNLSCWRGPARDCSKKHSGTKQDLLQIGSDSEVLNKSCLTSQELSEGKKAWPLMGNPKQSYAQNARSPLFCALTSQVVLGPIAICTVEVKACQTHEVIRPAFRKRACKFDIHNVVALGGLIHEAAATSLMSMHFSDCLSVCLSVLPGCRR